MQYDLAALARQAGVKRTTVEIRPIFITKGIEDALYRITRVPVDEWAIGVRDRILPAYDRAVSQLTLDGPVEDTEAAINAVYASVTASLVGLDRDVRQWLIETIGWHDKQWVANVKAALGVDVYPYVRLTGNEDVIAAMLQRNTSLIRSISDDLRKDVAEVVWREFQLRTPARKVASMIRARLQIGRRRALLIAADQSAKVSAELTMLRQTQAGIRRYRWDATMDARTRPLHAFLNGKVFEWGKPHPTERYPGFKIRCRCGAGAVLDLEDE